MRRINLGAGYDIRVGWINVDHVALPGIDVVHDLDVLPWPFETASINEIIGYDVFEHVDDPCGFVNECARILKTSGVIRLRTPHWRHENSYTDPTHKRHCSEKSFDYWIKGTEFNTKYGAAYCAEGVLFEQVSLELTDGGSNILIVLRRVDA